ncbi:hypothetical protein PSP6_680066 [Paraburkholderia tropica]|nr:hypothetical protein [Paraburkholderia tropica]CAG9235473.1 hypothetical protein PSP6_680066 [Paraburkholderia tropica]
MADEILCWTGADARDAGPAKTGVSLLARVRRHNSVKSAVENGCHKGR